MHHPFFSVSCWDLTNNQGFSGGTGILISKAAISVASIFFFFLWYEELFQSPYRIQR